MLSFHRALQIPGNTGIVPPYILEQLPKDGEPGNGGVVPPHLQPQPEPGNGNTGVVPPHLEPTPGNGNTGIVPPWLQPGSGVPGNTGIVPPHLRDLIEKSRAAAPGAPVLLPQGGHVATARDPFDGVIARA